MKVYFRLAALGSLVGLTILFIGCVLVPWAGGPSLFGADLQRACGEFCREILRGDAITRRDQEVQAVLDGKRIVTDELVAGKLSLAEATDRFRALQTRIEDDEDPYAGSYQFAGTDEESLTQNVIHWVYSRLRDDPAASGRIRRPTGEGARRVAQGQAAALSEAGGQRGSGAREDSHAPQPCCLRVGGLRRGPRGGTMCMTSTNRGGTIMAESEGGDSKFMSGFLVGFLVGVLISLGIGGSFVMVRGQQEAMRAREAMMEADRARDLLEEARYVPRSNASAPSRR